MSYSLGAALLAQACGPNARYNAFEKQCFCEPGYTSDDPSKGCTPQDPKKACDNSTMIRSPVDMRCTCPPGYDISPDPTSSDCVPIKLFPGCVDSAGRKIPGCIFGSRVADVVPYAVGGLVVGVVLVAIVRAIV